MTHVKEKEEQKQFFSDEFDATFQEAVKFMKEKLSLTPEEFYKLDAKARFRAFTVAKLTGLDAVERVKEKLTKAIKEGKTLKEWIDEMGEDGILKAVGFHQSNPWYLETVFRTNISTAYNAGRLMQFARSKDKIKYLEYVAIEDSRTTPICRRLDGTKLPPDDPFWATYTPPNHYNCYSEDTEVLTNEGWKKFYELTGRELFVSLNPQTHEIEYVRALRGICYHYKGKMIHLRARNFDLLVTPNHNMAYISSWKYKNHRKKGITPKVELRPAKDLADSDVIPRTGIWNLPKKETIRVGKFEFNSEDFAEFMGWYLAEGSITLKSKNYWQVKISQESEKYVQEIFALCKRLFERFGFKVHHWKGGIFVCGNDREFYEYFKSLGHSHEKYIPSGIKNLHVSALKRLLDAFSKGDGSCYDLRKINSQKGGKWQANFRPLKIYTTSSKRLADDLTEVILKCGKLPSLYPSEKPGKSVKFANGTYLIKHPTWVVAELNSKNFHVRKKDRAVKEGQKRNFFTVDYEGMVYCVELERNHILYVRRSGKCTWSGNCRSTVRAIFKGSNEAKTARKRKPKNIPPLPEGFNASPLDSWWKLTDSMAKRIVKYELKDEILEKAKKLCQKNLSDDWCEEYKEVEKYLRNAEEIVEKQQKAEKEFLKVLKEFNVEKPEESFKKLWVSERTYQNHIDDRLDEGVISGWKDYLEKTLETLALYSGVYYEVYSESWDRILYDRKRQWMVVLTEKGRIISSMKVNEKLKELFDRHIQKAKRDKQTFEIHRGKTNEELKREAEGVLKALRGKK